MLLGIAFTGMLADLMGVRATWMIRGMPSLVFPDKRALWSSFQSFVANIVLECFGLVWIGGFTVVFLNGAWDALAYSLGP